MALCREGMAGGLGSCWEKLTVFRFCFRLDVVQGGAAQGSSGRAIYWRGVEWLAADRLGSFLSSAVRQE
jgi:hypothetical protein